MIRQQLTALLGPNALAAGKSQEVGHALRPSWGRDRSPVVGGEPAAVVLPRATEEVAALVRWARRAGVALVPAGGRTGYSGGAVAREGQVVVALDRMDRRIAWHREVPAVTVQAGMVTRDLQNLAAGEGLFFPVDFAACDRSQIGGNVATNAGGIRVVRYGMTGRWVMGLTVVTGGGEVLRLGGPLLKNNTGPAPEHLFVGSEGTLGIITEITLRLTQPPARQRMIALLAAESLEPLLALLPGARRLPTSPLAYECFDAAGHRLMAKRLDGPLMPGDPAYLALLELESGAEEDRASAHKWLRDLPAEVTGRWVDGETEQARAWAYRLGLSDALAAAHRVHKNDLSVPVAELPALDARLRLLAQDLDLPLVIFGHLGDGNLHVNLLRPEGMSGEDFADRCERFDQGSYRQAVDLGGSISAEHGLGRLKREFADLARSPEERELLRGLKRVFDPDGIMNPGVGPY